MLYRIFLAIGSSQLFLFNLHGFKMKKESIDLNCWFTEDMKVASYADGKPQTASSSPMCI